VPDVLPPTIVEALYSYDIGGGERVAADCALGFARRGFRVICVGMYGNRGPLRDELEKNQIRCHDLEYTSRNQLLRRITYPLEMRRFLQRQRAAALHMHYGTSLLIAGKAARLAGVPRVLMTEHALHQYQARPDYTAATARVASYAHNISVVHPSQVDPLASMLGISASRIVYVPNGVQIPTDSPPRNERLRKEFGVQPDDFLVTAIGRLHETKDLPTLVAALSLLVQHSAKPFKLWIVGEGAERASIEQLITTNGLQSSVRLLGQRTDVAQILRAVDCVAMSSRTEGLPMTLIEAMANRVPCIATAVGGIPDLFRDNAGVLVPPSRADLLSAAIARVATDPAMRDALVDAGLRRVRESHDLEHSITEYLRLLGLPPRWPKPT
jgi:L-malate glycosyltransferase